MEYKKIGIKAKRWQKDELIQILRELKGFFLLPIGVVDENWYYYLDDEGFVRLGSEKFLKGKGYTLYTIESYKNE